MNPYHFKMSGKTVIIRHPHGGNMRASPSHKGRGDGGGGDGKWAQWTVHLLGGSHCKLQNNKSGKYLRLAKKGQECDVDGGGGQFTKFKIHLNVHPNGVKLESDVFNGRYVKISKKKEMGVGGGGPNCLFYFYKFGDDAPVQQVIVQPVQPIMVQDPLVAQMEAALQQFRFQEPTLQQQFDQATAVVLQLQATIDQTTLNQQAAAAQLQQQLNILLQQHAATLQQLESQLATAQQPQFQAQSALATLQKQIQDQTAALQQQRAASALRAQQAAALLAQQQAAAAFLAQQQAAAVHVQPVQAQLKPYHFKQDNNVVIRSAHGKHLRVRPGNPSKCDGNGGTGKFARWRVTLEGGKKCKIKNEHTGNYLRIKGNGDLDADGHGGGACIFKAHVVEAPNVFKIESKKNDGKYVAIKNDHSVKAGGGGHNCKLTFFRI